jgi:hypothetical protein
LPKTHNTLAFAVTALKKTSTNMSFNFCQDAGYAGLAQPDLPAGTMKVQLFGKSNYCAEIVKFQRRMAAHRKFASFERLAPGISILPKASKFSTERSPFSTNLKGFFPIVKFDSSCLTAFQAK